MSGTRTCYSLKEGLINKSQHTEASVDQAQTARKVCFTLSFSSGLISTGLGTTGRVGGLMTRRCVAHLPRPSLSAEVLPSLV